MTPIWIVLIATVLIYSHFVTCEPGEVFPVFTKTPVDVAIKTGGTARLECGAKGQPAPEISWRKDGGGEDFPAARERRMHVMPTDDVFFIVNVKPSDTGVYSCLAVSIAGTIAANATLTVLETPSFVKKMEDKETRAGETTVLECMASGSPKPKLTWTKDGGPLYATERHFFTAGNQLLIIVHSQVSDSGVYTCEMSNTLGTERGSSHLTIMPDPPRIETYPKDQTVASGGIAVFVCTAVGNPNPQIEWRKNGKRVTTQRYAAWDVPNRSVLRIEPVRAGQDDATYECVAENGVSEPVRALADLNVLPEDSLPEGFPKFIRQPNTQGFEKGRSALLPCQAEGDPEPNIKWLKNMIPLDMTINRYSLVQGSSLQITEAEEEDQGNYECMAENTHGSALSVMATLFVRALPRPPTNVRISDVTATSVRLSWSYDICSENIIYYVIQYKPKQANQEYSEISGITTMFYTVRDLSPYTEYEFYVIAVNGIGRGSASTPVVATTGETEPGSAPRNVQARPLSSSTVVIQWDSPKEPNGQVTGYKVYYTTRPNLPTSAWNTQPVDNNQLTNISDLTPRTIYTIRIQAFTSRGPGPHSAPVQVKTQQGESLYKQSIF